MRVDRLLTLCVFHRFQRQGSLSNPRIPILMYHSISKDVDNYVHPYYRTVTTPRSFERHVRWLSKWGFRGITLSEGLRFRPQESDLRKPVVITFDDGFRDFYTAAYPILLRFQFNATVFLATGFLDSVFITGRECLRRSEVRELAGMGIEFGSHTVNHPHLYGLGTQELEYELTESRMAIEDITGLESSVFSYPYRFPEGDEEFVQRLADLLIHVGYRAGVTTRIGVAKQDDEPLFLRRIPLNDCDDENFLEAKLAGAYDWLYGVQRTYKRLKVVLKGRA